MTVAIMSDATVSPAEEQWILHREICPSWELRPEKISLDACKPGTTLGLHPCCIGVH